MIAETWGGFFTIGCIALAFFFAGILWEHENAAKREEQRAARRRSHRYTTQKESN